MQIFDNQSSLIIKFERCIFKRYVLKNAQFYLYVIRQIEENTKATQTSEKITSFYQIIDYLTLNKKLKNNLLKIFKNDLFK